jgi:hypothetical protein
MTSDSAQHLAIMQARNKAFRWPKGTSGRTPLARCYHQAREIARRSSPEMMRRLVELARTSEDGRVAAVCAMAVLDRGGLKPIDYDPAEEAANRKPTFDPSLYTTEELEQLHAAIMLMVRKQGLLPEEEAAEATKQAEIPSATAVANTEHPCDIRAQPMSLPIPTSTITMLTVAPAVGRTLRLG